MYTLHFVYPFIPQWTLGLLPSLAILSIAAMNLGVKVPTFSSFGYITRSGITGSYGNSVFKFLRNYMLFSTAAALFYIPTSNTQDSISPQRCQLLLSSVFISSWF